MDSIISSVLSLLWTPMVQQMKFLFNVGANVRDLKKAAAELKLTKGEVEQKIETAMAATDEEEPTERVKDWLNKVRDMEEEVARIEYDHSQRRTFLPGCPLNCWSSYRISRRAANTAIQVKELKSEEGKLDAVTKRTAPALRRMPILEDAPPATQLEKTIDYLRDDSVGMVGIWGMGGVGKTSLLRRINNHSYVAAAGFNYVILAVASQDLNLYKLQREIAKRVGLALEEHGATIESQAASLFYYLKKKKLLLLLDDLWEPLHLEKLGIPFPGTSNNNIPSLKVVFTTRSETVCDRMMAYQKFQVQVRHKTIKVECLKREEAWQLFLNNIGETVRTIISSDERVCRCAERVAAKCGGLPLALIVIAQAMSTNKTRHEWEDAVNSLNKLGIQEIWCEGTDPFPLLKVSYDRLMNDRMRKCFLCCALWPEDHNIEKEELILCWLGLDLIDDFNDIGAAFSRGHTIIQSLKRACLLEEVEVEEMNRFYVKMHDVIRDMALWIASDCGVNRKRWMVQAGLNLKAAPEEAGEWREAEIASLMHNSIQTLPQSPNCPNLIALMLQCNRFSFAIPHGFFQNMPTLTYLDLSHSAFTGLPSSVGRLVSLRYLQVGGSLRSLPKELISLTKLKYLILSYSVGLVSIPHGLISRLEKLEMLHLCDTRYDGWEGEGEASIEEFECTRVGLKALGINLSTLSAVERLSKNPRVSLWRLQITGLKGVTTLPLSQTLLQSGNARRSLQLLQVRNCNSLEELLMAGGHSKEENQFENLEVFKLFVLPMLKKITWVGGVVPELRYLENLQIIDCAEMEQVIVGEEEGGGEEVAPKRTDGSAEMILLNLKVLILHTLPSLSSFCSHEITFPYLKYVTITACWKLNEAPFSHLTIRRPFTV